MAMLSGTIKCENCNEPITWYHQLAQPMSASRFDVDTPPKDGMGLQRILPKGNKCYHAQVHCKKCGFLNDFDFEDTEDIVGKSGGRI